MDIQTAAKTKHLPYYWRDIAVGEWDDMRSCLWSMDYHSAEKDYHTTKARLFQTVIDTAKFFASIGNYVGALGMLLDNDSLFKDVDDVDQNLVNAYSKAVEVQYGV